MGVCGNVCCVAGASWEQLRYGYYKLLGYWSLGCTIHTIEVDYCVNQIYNFKTFITFKFVICLCVLLLTIIVLTIIISIKLLKFDD